MKHNCYSVASNFNICVVATEQLKYILKHIIACEYAIYMLNNENCLETKVSGQCHQTKEANLN